jgi:hypothetical protein
MSTSCTNANRHLSVVLHFYPLLEARRSQHILCSIDLIHASTQLGVSKSIIATCTVHRAVNEKGPLRKL